MTFTRLMNVVPENGVVLINGDDENCVEVAKSCRAKLLEVGFSESAGRQISAVQYDPAGSEFTLLGRRFRVPLVGEYNVRNAAMAICAAETYGIDLAVIAHALSTFEGVKRRQEVRGEVKGITIIDDFGHHPTAIREALRGLRHQYPGRRLWAIFEPRSNTTRRAVFQRELPLALGVADGVILAQVARQEQLATGDRLDPLRVVAEIEATGKPAFYEPDVEAILQRIKPLAKEGDVMVILSNGGFGNIHERLLAEL